MTKPITRPTQAEMEEALICLTKLGETEQGGIVVGPRGWDIVQDVVRRLKGTPRQPKQGSGE